MSQGLRRGLGARQGKVKAQVGRAELLCPGSGCQWDGVGRGVGC